MKKRIKILLGSMVTFGALTSTTLISCDNMNDILKYKYDDVNHVAIVSGHRRNLPQNIIIPSEVKKGKKIYKVTAIGNSAFYRCTEIKQITIPSSVTTIDDHAFQCCSGITEITIPNSVTTIGHGAFGCCSGLTEITISCNVTKIGEQCFGACNSLQKMVVDYNNEKYTSGPDGSNCIVEKNSNTLISACKTTKIPNFVETIDAFVFESCVGLTEITIPISVTTIGFAAFSNCKDINDESRKSSKDKHGFWFVGTKEQWHKITKRDSWHLYCTATQIYCVEDNSIVSLDY